MCSDVEKFKNDFEEQKTELLAHIARLSMAARFDWEIPDPDEESPLAEVMVALRMAAENLDLIASQREAYTQELLEKMALIERQRIEIMELSTPAIEVAHGILMVPLIGAMDSQRAQQFTEKLLERIEATRSRVAVIDITGASAVDARTADHLFSAMKAAKMLGANVIITGVSTNNAMTLARLGAEFNNMVFKGSLKEGIKWAMKSWPAND